MSDELVLDNKLLSLIVSCAAVWLKTDAHTVSRRKTEVSINFFRDGLGTSISVDVNEFNGLTFREAAQLLVDKAQ